MTSNQSGVWLEAGSRDWLEAISLESGTKNWKVTQHWMKRQVCTDRQTETGREPERQETEKHRLEAIMEAPAGSLEMPETDKRQKEIETDRLTERQKGQQTSCPLQTRDSAGSRDTYRDVIDSKLTMTLNETPPFHASNCQCRNAGR